MPPSLQQLGDGMTHHETLEATERIHGFSKTGGGEIAAVLHEVAVGTSGHRYG